MSRFLVCASFARVTLGLAFPSAEPTSKDHGDAGGLTGWSPKPTSAPQALFERDLAGSHACGWYEDSFGAASPLVCPRGTCMAYEPSGATAAMIGCCASFNGGMNYQKCGWVSTCYDYADVQAGLCDDDCQSNTFNKVCSKNSLPYCQSWTYPGIGAQDHGCDTESESVWTTVSADVADSIEGTASAQIAMLPASVVVATSISSRESATLSDDSAETLFTFSDGSTSTSFPSVSNGSKGAAIALLIAIIAVCAGLFCVGGCIVVFFCRRSKKNVAKWKANGSAIALIHTQGQQTVPLTPTNVMPPAGFYAGRPSYSEQQAIPQNGAAASYYAGDGSKSPVPVALQSFGHTGSVPGSPAPYVGLQHGAVEASANLGPRPHYAELR